MNIAYSLCAATIAVVIFYVLWHLSDIKNVVKSLMQWIADYRQLRTFPSPPKTGWFWGHFKEMGPSEKTLNYYLKNHEKYPKWCVYWIGPFIPMVYSADPEIIKAIYQQPGETKRPSFYRYCDPWLGHGVGTTDGPRWRKYRRILTPSFHFESVKKSLPTTNAMTQKLMKLWVPLADTGKSVDVVSHIFMYTMDNILKNSYSVESKCLETLGGTDYVQAIEIISSGVVEQFYTPYFAIGWIYFNTEKGKKFLKACDYVHAFSEKVIADRKAEFLKSPEEFMKKEKFDVIDVLVTYRDKDGVGLTDLEMRENADTIIFGGFETTASVLSWVLYALAGNPDTQELCRQEINKLLADRDSEDLTWDDLSELTYITMCIKETMRLHPIEPATYKLSHEDIEMDGYRLPKGSLFSAGIYTMHRDPKLWKDPETFDPERFSAENMQKMHPYQFIPFSAGARNCIGHRVAMTTMRIATALIIKKFKVAVDYSHKVEGVHHIAYKPKDEIKLFLSLVNKEET